jgi:hypothetical protein
MSRTSALSAAVLLVLAIPASGAPILSATPSTIALSPTQTVITFAVDPNDTPLAALVFNLSALASGLEIVGIQSLDAQIITSGPALVGGDYLAGFAGTFFPDRSAPFTVGTVTVEGLTPGTPLVLSGNFTDSSFNDIPVGPSDVAIVMPEPTALALLSLGLLGLALMRRTGV